MKEDLSVEAKKREVEKRESQGEMRLGEKHDCCRC